jgi:hypothetical protein
MKFGHVVCCAAQREVGGEDLFSPSVPRTARACWARVAQRRAVRIEMEGVPGQRGEGSQETSALAGPAFGGALVGPGGFQ